MPQSELQKRTEDLAERCRNRAVVTSTAFLTPAEQYELRDYAAQILPEAVFAGGRPEAERKVLFFLPEYMTKADFREEDYITAVKAECRFGNPGHRDYMGAVLGLGVRREWIGDILAENGAAYIYCLPSVQELLLRELSKVGRFGVAVSACPLAAVPQPEPKVQAKSFTVKSLRLDAVTGELFGLSRTAAAEAIRLGAVSLNYTVCEKTDAAVDAGDVISFRGRGKGSIVSLGDRSKKDRLYVNAELRK